MSFFIQSKVYLIPLGMEYNIIQMTTTASFHSMDSLDLIFDDSLAQIRLYFSDYTFNVVLQTINCLWFVGIAQSLHITP